MSGKGTRAIDVLRHSRVQFTVHEYESNDADRTGRDRDRRPAYGVEAAAALGVDQTRIFKTLVASVDERLVSAVVPVAAELDLKRLADAVDGRRAVLAAPDAAERSTGYVVGGISPLGQRRKIATIVDDSALGWPTIYVSGGRRGLQIELAPRDLVQLAEGRIAPIARRRAEIEESEE